LGLVQRRTESLHLSGGRGRNPSLPGADDPEGPNHSSNPNTLGAEEENSSITLPLLLE
jgi:hypothetical protein